MSSTPPPPPPQMSPDGKFYWDGDSWVPYPGWAGSVPSEAHSPQPPPPQMSPDGTSYWDGDAWVAYPGSDGGQPDQAGRGPAWVIAVAVVLTTALAGGGVVFVVSGARSAMSEVDVAPGPSEGGFGTGNYGALPSAPTEEPQLGSSPSASPDPTGPESTPAPALYGTCQLAAGGHNARMTVGGPGADSGVCSGLLSALGSDSGGWVVSATPPPALPTTGVVCSVPANLLPDGDQGVVTDSGGRRIGQAACTSLASASISGPCPPAITGQISGAGNRIPLHIEVSGPLGTRQEDAIFDTGGVNEYLPDEDLQAAGFTPTSATTTSVAGWTGTANIYSVPASGLLVLDAGKYVPIATGSLTVYGVPRSVFSDYGIDPLVGPNVLQQGARFSSSGSQWAFTPACG